MREFRHQLVRLHGDYRRRVVREAGLRITPCPPKPREHEQVAGAGQEGARRSLLCSECLRPLEPSAHRDQAPLILEGLRVKAAGGELVGAGIEGEVFGDEAPAGGVGGQETP